MYSSTMPMASSQNTRKLPNDLPTDYRDRAPPRYGENLSPLTVHNRTSRTLVYDGLASPEQNSFSNARARELFGTVRIREHYRNLSNPSVPYYPQPNSPNRVGTPVRDLQVTGLQLSETAGRSYMDEPPTTQLISSNTNKPPVRIYSPVLQTVNSYSGSVTSKGMSPDPRGWSVGQGSRCSNDVDPNHGELVYARRMVSETHTSRPLSPQNQPALVSSNPVAVPQKYSHTTLPKNLDKMYDQMRLNGSGTVGPDRPSSPARVDWMERKHSSDAHLAEPIKVRSDRPPETYIPVPPAASNATSTSIVPYGVKNSNERLQSRNTNYPPPPPYSAIANGAEKSLNQSSTGIYGPVCNRNGTTSTEKPPEAVSGFDAPHRGPHVGLLNHGNTCYMSVIFQCLRFTPSIYSLLTSNVDSSQGGKLFTSMSELFQNMAKQAPHRELYKNVENVRASMGSNASQYSGSDQQDATEFLTCLLDMLHSEIKTKRDNASNSTPNNSPTQGILGVPSSTPEGIERSATVHKSHEQNGHKQNSSSQGSNSESHPRDRKEQAAQKSLSPVRHTGKSDTPPESLRRFPTPWNKPLRGKKKSTLRRPCALICIDPPESEDKSVIKLDRMHPAIQFWEQENKSEASPVRDTFMSLLQSYRKCPQCSTEKLCYSVVWNLGVPIPQNSGDTNSSEPSTTSTAGSQTNLQSVLEQGTRYGGSPSVTGQIGDGSKANILYDGSTSQSGPNPLNTWPKNKSFVLFDDSNAPPSVATSSSSTNCTSSAVVTTAYSLAPNRLQTPPTGSPPPPYSYTATARRSVPAVSLNDCLDAFMLTEVLDGADRPMCANCGKKTACELHHSITRLPDILIIHLLRFCCGDLRQKIDVPVDFPNMINMTEYTQSEYERRHKFTSPNQNANDHIYWLYAVVYHDGSMSYGHYTTACRTTTGADPSSDQWHHFDDEFVKEMRPDEVHKSSAYLLFYERDSLYQQRKSTQMRPVNGIRCIDTRQPRAQAHTFETRV